MNLSSVLIVAKEEKHDEICKKIEKIEHCSVELKEQDKIIVVIESKDLDSELKAYKELEKLENIISINMVFSYQDLDEDMQKIAENNLASVLEKNEKAEDIKYYGSVVDKY